MVLIFGEILGVTDTPLVTSRKVDEASITKEPVSNFIESGRNGLDVAR